MREVIGRTPIEPCSRGAPADREEVVAGTQRSRPVPGRRADPAGPALGRAAAGRRGGSVPRRATGQRRLGQGQQRGRGLPQRHHPARARRGGAHDPGSARLPRQPGSPRARRGATLHRGARRVPAGAGHHLAAQYLETRKIREEPKVLSTRGAGVAFPATHDQNRPATGTGLPPLAARGRPSAGVRRARGCRY